MMTMMMMRQREHDRVRSRVKENTTDKNWEDTERKTELKRGTERSSEPELAIESNRDRGSERDRASDRDRGSERAGRRMMGWGPTWAERAGKIINMNVES